MDQREFEALVEHVLQQDFSAGTEQFRDTLLERCLAALGTGEEGAERNGADLDDADLDDADLSMLAAAGDTSGTVERRLWENNKAPF